MKKLERGGFMSKRRRVLKVIEKIDRVTFGRLDSEGYEFMRGLKDLLTNNGPVPLTPEEKKTVRGFLKLVKFTV